MPVFQSTLTSSADAVRTAGSAGGAARKFISYIGLSYVDGNIEPTRAIDFLKSNFKGLAVRAYFASPNNGLVIESSHVISATLILRKVERQEN